MADKLDYQAKLNTKQLGAHMTEEQARRLCLNQGSRVILIIEAHAGAKMVAEDGTEKVSLLADLVEVVPGKQEDVVRELMAALHANRPDQIGQGMLDGTKGPSLDQATAQVNATIERDADGHPVGVWDGDPDSPVAAQPVEKPAGKKPTKVANPFTAVPDPAEEMCVFPGCVLPEHEDDDHDIPADATAD